MKMTKERKRNSNRRSRKRKYGSIKTKEIKEHEIVIDKPSEDIIKKQLKGVSDVTGISIIKKKGFVPYMFDKFNDTIFPKLTEERERNLNLKKKFLLWLIRRGGGIKDYIVQSYAHMLHKGDFLERMIASDNV
jgi:hypothetical protein